mmetsp:Transcript_7515/g.8829  ORF Transcript_7515/g.8829 Transcript_7515/m.8829 type:complete len:256 (-) Transcript_7515:343-1110(-)
MLHLIQVRCVTYVTVEDLGPWISGVGIGVAEAFFHVVSSRDLSNLLEEGGVVGDPIALLSQIGTHILPHNGARHLLQDSEKTIRDFSVGFEAIHHCNHPLIVDGARVEGREPFHPAGPIHRSPIGQDGSSPRQDATRLDELTSGVAVERIGRLLNCQARTQSVKVITAVELTEVATLHHAVGAATHWKVILLKEAQHRVVAGPSIVTHVKITIVWRQAQDCGAMTPETCVLSSTFQRPLGGRVCNTIKVLFCLQE